MAAPSVTYNFIDATTIVHSEVNQNFTDLINGMSDGNDDFTISALTCGGAVALNANVDLGNATGDDIAITGRVTTDIDPKTAATNTLGDATQTWLSLYLDGGVTDGGAIYFNASSTAFIKSNAAGTDLLIDAFTTLTVDANIVPQTNVTNTLGTASLNYTALHLDNSATDGGAVFFNAGTTAFLKSNAAGTTLSSGGFTTVALPAVTVSTTLAVTGIATFTGSPKIGRINELTSGAGVEIQGATDGGAVAAGYIGEVIQDSRLRASWGTIATTDTLYTTYHNWSSTGLVLSAGIWLISGHMTMEDAGANTELHRINYGVGLTSASAIGGTVGDARTDGTCNYIYNFQTNTTADDNGNWIIGPHSVALPGYVFNTASGDTLYGVVSGSVSGNDCRVWGNLTAVRIG